MDQSREKMKMRGRLTRKLFLIGLFGTLIIVIGFERLRYSVVNISSDKFFNSQTTQHEVTENKAYQSEVVVNRSREQNTKHYKWSAVEDLIQDATNGINTTAKLDINGSFQQGQHVEVNIDRNSRNVSNGSIPWSILITVNSAFFDFYKNWLWHFKQLNLPADIPVIVIAEDEQMYKQLKELNTPGIIPKKSSMEAINSSLVFNTPAFKRYMSRRAVYVLEYLEQGYNILHVDVDSVWLKDPFPYLVGEYDLWGQVDKPANVICIGFVAFKSNDAVIKLVRLWINRMNAKTNKLADQDVFKVLLPGQKHIRVNRLPSDEFPSGKLYFDQFTNATRAKTVVVHNNWVIGHDTKRKRFQEFNLWKA